MEDILERILFKLSLFDQSNEELDVKSRFEIYSDGSGSFTVSSWSSYFGEEETTIFSFDNVDELKKHLKEL